MRPWGQLGGGKWGMWGGGAATLRGLTGGPHLRTRFPGGGQGRAGQGAQEGRQASPRGGLSEGGEGQSGGRAGRSWGWKR